MKLLICTQKVDEQDPNNVLSFFVRWLKEFAKQCDEVHVICLQKGSYDLPPNVHVYSLGKEAGESRVKYISRFYKYIFSLRHVYDSVLVHMNPEYVILGGLFWKLMRKKIGLWYVHKSVTCKLRIAEKLAQVIFTSAPESFRITSRKVHVVGNGIDTEFLAQFTRKPDPNFFTILHSGRVTRIKNLDVMIRAVALLQEKLSRPMRVVFFGGTTNADDVVYEKELHTLADELHLSGHIEWLGMGPYSQVPIQMNRADISINLCPTGGIDKAVPDSVICGTPVFVSNEAFRPYFSEYADIFMVKYRDPEDLAEKITQYVMTNTGKEIKELQRRWTAEFGLPKLISKITALLK